MDPSRALVRLHGHRHLRERLVLAVLSGRALIIDRIRADSDAPGLADYEITLLKLLDAVTNGTEVRISHTGTQLVFSPGVLVGGPVDLEIPPSRAVGYYLEALIAVAPFAKKPVAATLHGGAITACEGTHRAFTDASADTLRTATLPFLSRAYGLDAAGLELQVVRRGAPPLGGGSVRLVVQPAHPASLRPAQGLTDAGRIRKIRGVAACTRVSPALATRIANSARAVLTRYIPDVYVYADAARKEQAGASPGFSLSLVAESTTNIIYTADVAARPRTEDDEGALNDPELLGETCAKGLLEAIAQGACVDRAVEWLALVFAVTCSDDVSKLILPRRGEHGLDKITIQYLRDLHTFFNVQFKISEPTQDTVQLAGVGVGYNGIFRKVV
ncbi:hypothetical protein GGF32_000427 [Allomyces javanicus]|nr:hypothetical protein GGF32_000427 [Allomyces javanicus]